MANMSYCRFQNTYTDFIDCFYALEEDDDISAREKYYAEKLRDLAEQYIERFDEMREDGTI